MIEIERGEPDDDEGDRGADKPCSQQRRHDTSGVWQSNDPAGIGGFAGRGWVGHAASCASAED